VQPATRRWQSHNAIACKKTGICVYGCIRESVACCTSTLQDYREAFVFPYNEADIRIEVEFLEVPRVSTIGLSLPDLRRCSVQPLKKRPDGKFFLPFAVLNLLWNVQHRKSDDQCRISHQQSHSGHASSRETRVIFCDSPQSQMAEQNTEDHRGKVRPTQIHTGRGRVEPVNRNRQESQNAEKKAGDCQPGLLCSLVQATPTPAAIQ
jgi:hypothetical protein